MMIIYTVQDQKPPYTTSREEPGTGVLRSGFSRSFHPESLVASRMLTAGRPAHAVTSQKTPRVSTSQVMPDGQPAFGMPF